MTSGRSLTSSCAKAVADPGSPRRLSSAVPASAMAWPTTKMLRTLIMSSALGSAKAVFDRLERLRGHRRAGEKQGQDPGMAQQGRAQRLRVAAQHPVPGQAVGEGRGGGGVLQDPLDQPVKQRCLVGQVVVEG